MFLAMTLAQLFKYENQPIIMSTLMPFDDQPLSSIIAALIILAQVLGLPYLLGMYISRLMRILCAVSGTSASLFWLLTSLTNSHASNSGLFSSALDVPGGLIPAVWSMILFAGFSAVVFADSKFRHDSSS